jgi:hypothetical protein
MMKLEVVSEFGAKVARAETCGMAGGARAVVVVEWAAVDSACMSEFGGGV